ncbi:kinase-like domain-containing protein [Rhizophagus irregularis DAOM 181602=DAOM 197198]|nr:kinase-like domain-containing protein [Rhizophagus irregularis DAOM 181602=DAOM 197198]
MDISNQNLDTTEITIRNNSKTDAKNLWKYDDGDEYQAHATIFSTDSTTESDETISFFKKVNIMDLEKRKEVYGVCGECNQPGTGLYCNDFLNEIKYYISGHFHANGLSVIWECVNHRLLKFENLPEPVNSTDYSSSYQEIISSSSENPISECLDCELNELDLNQDDDE